MNRVIVFCGKSGSGKTTLAQKISKELNIYCLSKDVIKETLYDLYGGRTLEDSNYHGKQSILLLNSLAEEALKAKVDLILEAPFNHPENIQNFQKWSQEHEASIHIVVCEVSEEVRMKRLLARQASRHRSHHEQERFEQGQYLMENFDYTQMPAPKIVVDTSELEEKNLQKIREFLAI